MVFTSNIKKGDSVKIPENFLFYLISFQTFLFSFLYVWIAFEEKFNSKFLATNLASAMAVLPVTVVYISLTMKTDQLLINCKNLLKKVNNFNLCFIKRNLFYSIIFFLLSM